jgi:hypothetical protein
MPVKDIHIRTKPLALASGHGRCIAPERTLAHVGQCPLNMHSRHKFAAISLPRRLRNTAVSNLKPPPDLDPEVV